jgi:glycerophosphoryl diester phosphodiesterase
MLADRLVAHRGYQRLYPENTLLSVREAIAAGASFVEVDIQFTADGEPVVYHDATLIRVSGEPAEIHQLSAAQAAKLPACEPFRLGDKFRHETICHLSDLVALATQFPSVHIFVELKKEAVRNEGCTATFETVSRLLQPIRDRAILISFDREFIAHARAQGWPRVGFVITSWHEADDLLSREVQPDYIFSSDTLLPESDPLPELSSLLVVYEVAEPEIAKRLFRRGVDMVETFDIGGMIAGLANHSL